MNANLIEQLNALGAETQEAIERSFMSDEETYLECVFDFLDDPSMQKLSEAVALRDADMAARAVHTLKGLADSFGFMPLLDEASDMLRAFRKDNAEAAFGMIEGVRRSYDEFTNVIRAYR